MCVGALLVVCAEVTCNCSHKVVLCGCVWGCGGCGGASSRAFPPCLHCMPWAGQRDQNGGAESPPENLHFGALLGLISFLCSPLALEFCSSPELACHVYGMWK